MTMRRRHSGSTTRTAGTARRSATLFCLAALLAGAGCANVSRETTGSVAPATARSQASLANKPLSHMTANELRGAVAAYGRAYEANPKDKNIGLSFAAALQMAGRNDQSLAVMQQVAIAHSKDRDVLSAYGKALAAAGDLTKALETIRRAQTPDYPDWRLFSAEGAILDQLGRSQEARALYRKALDLQPNEPSVLSNLGMSYLLGNDLVSAERTLRQAVTLPDADSRIRQNLALVVGLQGRFEEAEAIASAELSPNEAEANVAFLRQMLAQQNTWSKLEKE